MKEQGIHSILVAGCIVIGLAFLISPVLGSMGSPYYKKEIPGNNLYPDKGQQPYSKTAAYCAWECDQDPQCLGSTLIDGPGISHCWLKDKNSVSTPLIDNVYATSYRKDEQQNTSAVGAFLSSVNATFSNQIAGVGGISYPSSLNQDKYCRCEVPFIRQWSVTAGSNTGAQMINSLAIGSNDNIYVLNTGGRRIDVFTPSGDPLSTLHQWTYGSGTGQFAEPDGIAVDDKGNVYVDDTGNHRVTVISPTGTVTDEIPIPEKQMPSPRGIGFDKHYGIIYILDTDLHRIWWYQKSTVAWGVHQDQSNDIQGSLGPMAADSSGQFYVAAPYLENTSQGQSVIGHIFRYQPIIDNSKVMHGLMRDDDFINTAGWNIGTMGGAYKHFALNGWNGFYANVEDSTITRFDPSGVRAYQWGTDGDSCCQFRNIDGIAVNSGGDVYVADGYDRIQEFSPDVKPSCQKDVPLWINAGISGLNAFGPWNTCVELEGPYEAHFVDRTDSLSGYPTTWFWHFGDGSPPAADAFVQNPVHVYDKVGTYQVSLEVNNTCSYAKQYLGCIQISHLRNTPYTKSNSGEGNHTVSKLSTHSLIISGDHNGSPDEISPVTGVQTSTGQNIAGRFIGMLLSIFRFGGPFPAKIEAEPDIQGTVMPVPVQPVETGLVQVISLQTTPTPAYTTPTPAVSYIIVQPVITPVSTTPTPAVSYVIVQPVITPVSPTPTPANPVTCPYGYTNCNGNCVNVQSDPSNCGSCGHTCLNGQTTCRDSQCEAAAAEIVATRVAGGSVLACRASGKFWCNNACTDIHTDNNNCGSCGTVCTGGSTCNNGECR